MIRGRSIQFAIENFFLSNKFKSLKNLQKAANNYYFTQAYKYPLWFVKRYSKAINPLIRATLNLIRKLDVECLTLKNKRLFLKFKRKGLIPDFVFNKVKINRRDLENIPVELKILSLKSSLSPNRAVQQAATYSTIARKPCLLLIIILGKFANKTREYEVFQTVLLVKKK